MYLRNYLKLILKSTIICWLIFWNAINIHIPEKTVTQLIRVFKYKNNLFSMIQKTKSYSQHRKAFITFLNHSELNCSLIIPVTNEKDQISVYVHWSPVNPPVSFPGQPLEQCTQMYALISWNFLFHQSSTKSPCKRLSNQNWFRGHAHARLARLVFFFKAIWSKTIRFRLDLLRCCNISILRNLDVSVCGSWIKKEKPMATKATTLLLEASMVLEFPASSISWRR